MAKTAALSVRIPVELKTSLEARAKRLRRSLSAQITHDLEQLAATESLTGAGGKLLGRYASSSAGSSRGGTALAAVAAELALLYELGRVQIGLTELKDVMENVSSFRFLPLDLGQVTDFAALSGIREAFDRFIVATARSVGGKLITRDQAIVDAKLVQTIWR